MRDHDLHALETYAGRAFLGALALIACSIAWALI